MSPRPLYLTTSGIAGTLLVVLVVIVCARLGFWQLDRLDQRRERNALIEARLAEPPVPLERALGGGGEALVWRRVTGGGVYDNERTLVLAGRAMDGQPGVYVVTPLRTPGGAVLVERGFVASPDAATVDLAGLDLPAADSVLALARRYDEPSNRRSQPVTRGGGAARVYRMDEAVLRELVPYPIAGFWLQALPDTGRAAAAPRGAGPRPAGIPSLDEGSHFGYAVQWFSFAAIAAIGWLVLLLRRRRTDHG